MRPPSSICYRSRQLSRLHALSCSFARSRRSAGTLASFKVPKIENEPNKHYAPGTLERKALEDALAATKQKAPLNIPLVIGGKEVREAEARSMVLLSRCLHTADQEPQHPHADEPRDTQPPGNLLECYRCRCPSRDRSRAGREEVVGLHILRGPCQHLPQGCEPDLEEISIRNHGADHAWSGEERMASRD